MRSFNTSEHSSNDLGEHIKNSKITMRHIRFIIKDSTRTNSLWIFYTAGLRSGFYIDFEDGKLFCDILPLPS